MVGTAVPVENRLLTYPWRQLRSCLRTVLHTLIEVSCLAKAGPRGAAPVAVFLPSRGREMSSLLRIYLVAAELRRHGWQTVVVPWRLGLRSRHRILSALKPDVVVLQGARHALNRPDLYPGFRIVYDMDDADFHLEHLADAARDAMARVDLVLAGSRYVADWCRAQGAQAEVIWTGTPISRTPYRDHAARGPIVAWAQTAPASYLGERAFVLDVMRRVRARHPDVRLRLHDRRPSEPATILEPFLAEGIAVEWQPRRDYGAFLDSLQDVVVGLSPICQDNPFSRGKSFGKILAYLDRGVPVVASDAVDHPLGLPPGTAILSNDPETCADAVCRLLASSEMRQSMADRGHARLMEVFAPARVGSLVDAALRRALRAPPRQTVAANPARVQGLSQLSHLPKAPPAVAGTPREDSLVKPDAAGTRVAA